MAEKLDPRQLKLQRAPSCPDAREFFMLLIPSRSMCYGRISLVSSRPCSMRLCNTGWSGLALGRPAPPHRLQLAKLSYDLPEVTSMEIPYSLSSLLTTHSTGKNGHPGETS